MGMMRRSGRCWRDHVFFENLNLSLSVQNILLSILSSIKDSESCPATIAVGRRFLPSHAINHTFMSGWIFQIGNLLDIWDDQCKDLIRG